MKRLNITSNNLRRLISLILLCLFLTLIILIYLKNSLSFVEDLKWIKELLVEILKHEFIPQVALCQEEAYVRPTWRTCHVYREDLANIKTFYCQNLIQNLQQSMDPLNRHNIIEFKQFGSDSLADTWFSMKNDKGKILSWYSVRYHGWPSHGGLIDIKRCYINHII
jgi:hypothetical protein